MAKIISVVSQTNIRVNTSLDKEELKNINKVSSSPVFSNENNWRLAIGIFKHTDSRRRMVCAFKGDFNSLVPMRIRPGTQAGDTYELRKILIVSQNNQGILSIPRAEIASASDYDFVIGEVAAPENFSATISSNASQGVYAAFSASISFNKSVSNFDLTKLSITNGTASSMSGSGSSYSFTVTPNGEGQVSISILAGQVTAADGSVNTVSNSLQRQYYAPVSASISTANGGSSFSEPFTINVVFNKSVTNFDVTNVMVTNGTAGSFNGSGANYNFLVTPTQDGQVSVDLDMEDVIGEDGSTSSTPPSPVNASYISPLTVSMTSDVPATVNGSFTVNIVFNKSVTGFELSDLSITNGVASDLININNSNANYSFTVTPSADGAVSVSLSSGAAIQGPSGESNSSASNAISTTYVDLKTLNLSSTGGNGLGTVSALLNNQTVFSSRPLTQTQSVSYDFQPGDDVQLSAKADFDNYFVGYNGAITSPSNVSNVLMNDDKTVYAGFNKSYNTSHRTRNAVMKFLPNGKIMAYGATSMLYEDRYCNLIRLNEDKTIDTTFSPAYFNNTVQDFAVDNDGNYIVVGDFTSFTGSISSAATTAGFTSGQANNANRIAKISSTGQLMKMSPGDAPGTTANGFNGSITSIVKDASGNIWVAGGFSAYYGDNTWGTKGINTNCNCIAKINSSGELLKISSVDSTGSTGNGFNGTVNCIVADNSNNIWVGGWFNTYYGASNVGTRRAEGNAYYIAKLNSAGELSKISAGDQDALYGETINLLTSSSGISVVNSPTANSNRWFTGTYVQDGSQQVIYYISPNSMWESLFNATISSVSHFYIDFQVSEANPILSFRYSTYWNSSINFKVTLVDPSVSASPVANAAYNPTSFIASTTLFSTGSNYETALISAESYFSSNPGTRVLRAVFSWTTSNAGGPVSGHGAKIANVKFTGMQKRNGFNGRVNSIAISSSNDVWIGGNFTTYYGDTVYTSQFEGSLGRNFIKGEPHSARNIARLNSAGIQQKISSSDKPGTAFGLAANGFDTGVRTIALDAFNNVWVGGDFRTWSGKENPQYDTIGATTNNCNFIAKINSSGLLQKITTGDKPGASVGLTKASTSTNGFNSSVNKIYTNQSGDVLVNGAFTQSWLDSSIVTLFSTVYLAKDSSTHFADYSLNFSSYDRLYRNINTLLGSNSLTSIVYKIKKTPDGKIMVFGNFRAENDERIWANAVRLEPFFDGDYTYGSFRIDPGFSPIAFNGTVNDFAVDSNNNYWFVGAFTSFTGSISSAATTAGFTSGQANNANRIAKVNSVGQLQLIHSGDKPGTTAASGNGFNGAINCIAIDNSNNVWTGSNPSSSTTYIGLDYTSVRNVTSNALGIAKINSSGQLVKISSADIAGSSNNGFNNAVNCITIDSSNNVWIGGNFTVWRGSISIGTGTFQYPVGTATKQASNANYICKLQPAAGGLHEQIKISSVDTVGIQGNGFDVGANINCIAIDSSNNIWVGGSNWTYYGGTTWGLRGARQNCNYIAKLNSSGNLLKISESDNSGAFNSNGFSSMVTSIAFDTLNNVWVGGNFAEYYGAISSDWSSKVSSNANRIAKLNSSGNLLKINSRDAQSRNGLSVSGIITNIVPHDGNIWIGMSLTSPVIISYIGNIDNDPSSNVSRGHYIDKGIILIHGGTSTRTW
jgi:hypothetical protein